jgi:hypothetical protein
MMKSPAVAAHPTRSLHVVVTDATIFGHRNRTVLRHFPDQSFDFARRIGIPPAVHRTAVFSHPPL